MQILVSDDCNIAWDNKLDFFMYGGIVVPESEMRPLAEQILTLKNVAGIERVRPIKWTNNRWNGQPPIDETLHARLKAQVLEVLASSSCKIIVCLSPQIFYHRARLSDERTIKMHIDPKTQERTQRYALNDALEKFQWYLEQTGEVGMVMADRFGGAVKAHMDQHCLALFPNNAHPNIIHSVIQMENEQSHLHQINDVALGAIYFSLREMGYNFLPAIRDNFWMETPGSYASIVGKGFNVYPLIARAAYVRAGKQNLQDKFIRLINSV